MTGLDGHNVRFIDNNEFSMVDGTSVSPAGPADARRGPASLERPGVLSTEGRTDTTRITPPDVGIEPTGQCYLQI
jgi:hypothetical protein